MTARYEALRQVALGKEPLAGHGLAVLIRCGVAAWMRMGIEETPDGTPRIDPDAAGEGPRAPEVVQVLANLTLDVLRG